MCLIGKGSSGSNFKILIFLVLMASTSFAQLNTKNQYYAQIKTNFGIMVFKLAKETPNHTGNFIKLAKQGYFDTYDFNRVLKNFVAQGGETDSAYAAMEKQGIKLQRIAPEFSQNLFHQKGALAAGRDDNKEESSFLGQIYIVDGKKYTDSTLNIAEKRIGSGYKFNDVQRKVYKNIGGVAYLDQHYTVFGQLIKGMDVFEKLMSQAADKAGKPVERIWMKVHILSDKESKMLN